MLVVRSTFQCNSLFPRFKVDKYKLHFICGVNEHVSGPEYSLDIGYNPRDPSKYYHSHINFLATCEDPQSVHAPAKLFFAECGNYRPNESWCLPVNLDQDTGMLCYQPYNFRVFNKKNRVNTLCHYGINFLTCCDIVYV